MPNSRQARQELNPQPPVLETGALPIELLAYKMADSPAIDFKNVLASLAMHAVTAAARAVLLQFQTTWIIAAVLLRQVIAFLALCASHRNRRTDIFLLRCHICKLASLAAATPSCLNLT